MGVGRRRREEGGTIVWRRCAVKHCVRAGGLLILLFVFTYTILTLGTIGTVASRKKHICSLHRLYGSGISLRRLARAPRRCRLFAAAAMAITSAPTSAAAGGGARTEGLRRRKELPLGGDGAVTTNGTAAEASVTHRRPSVASAGSLSRTA